MPLIEQRLAMIRVLALIDQRIAEAQSQAADSTRSYQERECAAAALSFRRRAAQRIEVLLAQFDR